jgi:cytochrome b6-f complex iron-sulfur subunit
MSDQPSDMPRRDFLNLAWGGMALLAAAGSGFVGLRFLTSQVTDGEFGGIVTAGVVADFPPASATAFNNGRFYLVRGGDGGFVAVYHRCTHLACVVLWQEAEGQFYCPCHGSRFSPAGGVLNPPAPRSLARFPVTIERDQVLVDTGTLISREIIELGDIAYPDDQEAGS